MSNRAQQTVTRLASSRRQEQSRRVKSNKPALKSKIQPQSKSNHARVKLRQAEQQADQTANRIQSGESGLDKNIIPMPAPAYQANRNVGKPIPENLKTVASQGLDESLDDVRIHDDASAHQVADRLGAKAFTSGEHIYFAENQFNPQTNSGINLFLHELTHVLQQRAGQSQYGARNSDPDQIGQHVQCKLRDAPFKEFVALEQTPDIKLITSRYRQSFPGNKELADHIKQTNGLWENLQSEGPGREKFADQVQTEGFIPNQETLWFYVDVLKALEMYALAGQLTDADSEMNTAFLSYAYFESTAGESIQWLETGIGQNRYNEFLGQLENLNAETWREDIVNYIQNCMQSTADHEYPINLSSEFMGLVQNELSAIPQYETLLATEDYYLGLIAFYQAFYHIDRLLLNLRQNRDQGIALKPLNELAQDQGHDLEAGSNAANHILGLIGETLETKLVELSEAANQQAATGVGTGVVADEDTQASSTAESEPTVNEEQQQLNDQSEAALETTEGSVDEEPNPTFEFPPEPDTELSAEEKARRDAEQQAQKDALVQATTASGAVNAYATASPSIMAEVQTDLGQKVNENAANDSQEFNDNLPDMSVEVSGEEGAEEVAPLDTESAAAAPLEEETPAPVEAPDLPPSPEYDEYKGNEGIVSKFLSLFGLGGSSKAVSDSLKNVKTKDTDVQTQAERPMATVPLEGETDPQRVEDQQQNTKQQAEDEKARAMQAVIDGPGPETVQPRTLEVDASIEEMELPDTGDIQATQEVEKYKSMALPEEVQAQFDNDMGEQMRSNLEEGRKQVEDAETTKDEQRNAKVVEAEKNRQELADKADEDQKESVKNARETIQDERQNTIDEQDKAVKDVETQAENERKSTREKIEKKSDEQNKEIETEYEKTEKQAETKVEEGEKDAEKKKKEAEKESEEKSWWDKAVDFVKEAFAVLTAAITAIFDIVRDAVNALLDGLKDLVKGMIDLFASVLKGLIEVFGELLKGLVDGLLGQIFPDLAKWLNEKIDDAVDLAKKAVDAVADTLKAGVDALVEGLRAGLMAIIDTFEGAIKGALSVLEAVLTGDWAGLLKKILESVLKLLGIEPEAFYAFIGKAMETIDIIVDAPIKFVGNILDAVKLGFSLFSENFLEHLKKGIIGWLTGALGDITIPDKFDLLGILDLARQIMGLTWEWVRKKAVKLIGEKNVERIEFVFDYIKTLVTEGWAVLFKQITDQLTGLKDMIFDAIKSFLVEKIIKAAIVWLVSLVNPAGAIVKLVLTIWNFAMFLKDQMSRIIGVFMAVVESIGNIARGVIQAAGKAIESVLGNLVPIAIDLLAKLLGLGNVAKKVKEIIGAIREKVDKAVDKVLDRVLKLFKGKGAGDKDKKGEENKEGDDTPIGKKLTVTTPGSKSHTLLIVEKGDKAEIVLRSREDEILQKLGELETVANGMSDETDKENKTKALQLIESAKQTANSLKPKADNEAKQDDESESPDIVKLEVELKNKLVDIYKLIGSDASGDDLLLIFGPNIEKAPASMHVLLKKIIRDNATAFTGKKWEEIRPTIIQHDAFSKPMRTSGGLYNKELSDKVLPEIAKAIGLDKDDKVFKDFINQQFVKAMPEFSDLVKKINANQLGESNEDLVGIIVAKAKSYYESTQQDKADPDVQAFNVTTLKQTMLAFAGAGGNPSVTWERWQQIWNESKDGYNPNNKERVSEIFRKMKPNSHEWIPTNYVEDVVNHAVNVKTADPENGPAIAMKWIELHDLYRTPTKGLIFHPKSDFTQTQRKVTGLRVASNMGTVFSAGPKPVSIETTKDFPVIQSHSGGDVVKAPVSDAGKYQEGLMQQIKGIGPWHDELRKVFNSNKGSTVSSIMSVIEEIEKFADKTVWKGDTGVLQEGGKYFCEYDKSVATLSSLAAAQKTEMDNILKQVRNMASA